LASKFEKEEDEKTLDCGLDAEEETPLTQALKSNGTKRNGTVIFTAITG